MNRTFTVIAALLISSSLFTIPSCGSNSSSSSTGYDVNLTDTISQHSLKPSDEKFTLGSGPSPSYDTTLTSGLTKRQYATIVLKQIRHTDTTYTSYMGFAVGEYNSNGKLLYKLITSYTVTSGLTGADGAIKLPDSGTTSGTYTLTTGSASFLVSQKAGAAPTRYTEASASTNATITLVTPANTTSSPATPAIYKVTFSTLPGTTGCTISSLDKASATSTSTSASN